jgi:hypothetical protein
MSKLDEYEVITLHLTQHVIPEAFGDESATTASRTGAIYDVHLRQVEVAHKRITPTLPTVGIVVGRGITDDKYRSQLRVN